MVIAVGHHCFDQYSVFCLKSFFGIIP